ncbi:tannase/feruloyl esterase family alpha/beta hydrolase [Amycolatopsis sp.]|uniref:tannase/feruloyl esterase family alpha/beta hydrolase n=1 Tax=Amycolatopsis sp. TaxID=37632 RepID=UPI002BB3B582|nr:tannase/feruloyl esterase family alpha/beta hydrolase [Amycolatopsis sp.]HVV12564.1 tannase/feruloyl esterase family alpha/beta hydrolase [Amycolatopsis sp.]
MSAIDLSGYVGTDDFFGAPFIEIDEQRERPSPHRFVQGGFAGTDTEFAFYFPPAESYTGRMFQPLEGGNGGHAVTFGAGVLGEMFQRIALSAHLGGYMVESNQGHKGDDLDPAAGEDATLYGHRASAESARLSKFVAAQVYGSAPRYSYVWGGSGGGRRSPLCLENAPGVWDGCLPSTSGGEIGEPGNTRRVQAGSIMSFGQMFNVQRILGRGKIIELADRMAPGGSGDPFDGLATHERDELVSLYRQGFPRGCEFMISEPMGQMWLWTSLADELYREDPEYFDNFWTKPGYVGHDAPELVEDDLINQEGTVVRTLSARDLNELPEFAGPGYQTMRILAAIVGAGGDAYEFPYAVEIEGLDGGYRVGTGVKILSGEAAGRSLYATGAAGDVFACDGQGDANVLRFKGVRPGDRVLVDNRKFLAYCYFARHHVMDDPAFAHQQVDGSPIYPQHPVPRMSPLMGVCYSGRYQGKVLWIHHTHDSSVWPAWGTLYHRAVRQAQGEAGARENFRIRWTEFAEHGPYEMVPPEPHRASATRLIDSRGITEQSMIDLIDWVENGIAPSGTEYTFDNGRVSLPASAAERGGIQPVASVTANGAERADVRVGETVTMEVKAAVPPGAGGIVSIEWDVDGTGTFPLRQAGIDGRAAELGCSTAHRYDSPGTYFVTARVTSHRDGDVHARRCRIETIGQARVVVS